MFQTQPTATSQPSIRPMYPSPASAYQPQMSQQPPPQFIPQPPNPNFPASSPLLSPSTTSTSNYPQPQYNYNSNPTSSAYPGQPPLMPYGMSTNAAAVAGVTNQQNNNPNGSLSVKKTILAGSNISVFISIVE